MLARMAAPPNKAAAPMAPVGMAAASSDVLLLASGLPAALSPGAPVFSGKPSATALVVLARAALLEVAEGTPEVNGTSLAEEAPGYALAGSSDSVPLAGEESSEERTLSRTWSTLGSC